MRNFVLKYSIMKNRVGFCVLLLLLVSCKTGVELPRLREDVAFLASDALKGRATGSTDEIEAATYLAKRLESMGYVSKGGAGTYFQNLYL